MFGTVLTWVERKQAAIMSDRIGANRAYVRIPFTQVKLVWLGLFHGLADGIKMMLKEDFRPNTYDRFAYAIAPWVVFTPVLLVFAVIPVRRHARSRPSCCKACRRSAHGSATAAYPMQIARLDAGLLVVFAFGGLTIIGAMLAGWSSSNKFSLLGALRAGSQMISYELIMGLTVLGLILIYGTVDLGAIAQRQSGMLLGFLPAWGIVLPAVRRDPVPDRGDRREQAHSVRPARGRVRAHRRLLHRVQRDEDGPVHVRRVHRDRDHRRALHDALPRRLQPAVHDRRRLRAARAATTSPLGHGAVVVIQLVVFLVKVMLVCSFQILVRWSLPRFRYDQLLRFAWKFMLPLALANLDGHRRRGVGAARREASRREGALRRKQYWNEPTMSWWERAYLPEIVRGLAHHRRRLPRATCGAG